MTCIYFKLIRLYNKKKNLSFKSLGPQSNKLPLEENSCSTLATILYKTGPIKDYKKTRISMSSMYVSQTMSSLSNLLIKTL